MNLQAFLRESTWGFPIISAIHVLGIAWFGGTLLVSRFDRDLRGWRRAGLALLLVSGAVLFWLQPAAYYNSTSFRAKMVLLAVLIFMKPARPFALVLWAAVIVASRGIAFF